MVMLYPFYSLSRVDSLDEKEIQKQDGDTMGYSGCLTSLLARRVVRVLH